MIQTIVPTQSNCETIQWISICTLEDIYPNTGVCAWVNGEQIAIFRVVGREDETNRNAINNNQVYAISNYDPFSQAYVLSRGLVGDRNGVLKVASPIYKQNFCLATGRCLDDETVSLPVFPVRVVDGQVEVGFASAA
ncbi:MAG: nitrite reductase small subunit NirD [Leptolyngbya sp. IPPAS B-1204]|nr:MAG: nitrite reductase small subunit NirD [Leptolyngbya sp. IPPAS B-1204]